MGKLCSHSSTAHFYPCKQTMQGIQEGKTLDPLIQTYRGHCTVKSLSQKHTSQSMQFAILVVDVLGKFDDCFSVSKRLNMEKHAGWWFQPI